MNRLLAGLLALFLAAPAVAVAQPNLNNLPAQSVVGRLGIGSGPGQAIPFANFMAGMGFAASTTTNGGVVTWGNTTGSKLTDTGILGAFKQPVAYPSNITFGHSICATDSDCQFGNSWSQYPLGVVSSNPLIVGKSGSTIGSTTLGQTFKIVFTSSGLTGSPITKTYTAGSGETTTTIAAGLCALVQADTVLHNAFGQPIFCQSLGGGVFNLQYTSAFSATGATPLTTATTGSTGTITLAAEQNITDFIVMQLGRNIPGRSAINGDTIFALDFTGQDSTGTFNTHYGQISVTATTATAGGTRGLINFLTSGNTGPLGRMGVGLGAYLYDSTGAAPTGGDVGAGVFNTPTAGGYYIGGNAVALNGALYSNNFFGGAAAGSTLNLQSTQSGSPSGDFVQIKAGGVVGYKFDGTTSTFGVVGSAVGKAAFANATSGTITLSPPTGALGSAVLTLPDATDTLVGLATTDTLTNKTISGATLSGTTTASGLLRSTFGVPTIASGACGTGTNGSISGTNQSGIITIGAAATASCTVSFSATLAFAPGACVIFPGNAAAAATGTTVARVGTPSTSAWVITGTALASTVYSYICL